ncbi:hypothetical protein BH10ACT1_BH10ACT1_16900 [soil metagenome]
MPEALPPSPLVIGVLYPWYFHQERGAQARELEALEAAFGGRVEVVVEPYVDSSELRTRRSAPGFARGPDDDVPVSDEVRALLARAHVLLALDAPLDTVALAPDLAWVQAVGSGTGQLRSTGLGAAGITLTNSAGTSADEIAEFVLGRILEHRKSFVAIGVAQQDHRWEPIFGRAMAGATVGLIGFGAINQAVARFARAFGMRVLASRRTPDSTHPDVERFFAPTDLAAMVAEADVVVAAVPESPETVGLLDRGLFAAMAPGAFVVNVGRGSVLVEADLLAALDAGQVGGAALDVFDDEPLPPENPLWSHPGVRVSAHCSSIPGASITRVHQLFRDNLQRHLDGRPLRNQVDLSGHA